MRKLLYLILFLLADDIIFCMDTKPKKDQHLVREMFNAVCRNDYPQVKSLLQEHPHIVNIYGDCYQYGQREEVTVLHLAQNPVLLGMILACDNVNCSLVTKSLDDTALHRVRDKRSAQMLFTRGIPVDKKNRCGETPLYKILFKSPFCVTDESGRLAHYLIKKGADVNQCIDDHTLLHHAVTRKKDEIICFLLQHGADPEIHNKYRETALSAVMQQADQKIVACFEPFHIFMFPSVDSSKNPYSLLKNDASFFKKLLQNDTAERRKTEVILAKIMACAHQPWQSWSLAGYQERPNRIVLSKNGYYFNNVSYQMLENFFGKKIVAYINRHLTKQCQTMINLLERPFTEWILPISFQTNHIFLLHYAEDKVFDLLLKNMNKSDNLSQFTALLQLKLHVNGTDEEGNSLLHRAVLSNNVKAIKPLIKAGISLILRNDQNQTAFDLAHARSALSDCYKVFQKIVRKEFCRVPMGSDAYKNLKKIINHKRFDTNIRDEKGRTLLFDVIKYCPEKCASLLRRGADTNIQDKKGKTPLRYAIEKCREEVVFLLLDCGVIVTENILELSRRSGMPHYLYEKICKTYKEQNQPCAFCNEPVLHQVQFGSNGQYKIICQACAHNNTGGFQSW